MLQKANTHSKLIKLFITCEIFLNRNINFSKREFTQGHVWLSMIIKNCLLLWRQEVPSKHWYGIVVSQPGFKSTTSWIQARRTTPSAYLLGNMWGSVIRETFVTDVCTPLHKDDGTVYLQICWWGFGKWEKTEGPARTVQIVARTADNRKEGCWQWQEGCTKSIWWGSVGKRQTCLWIREDGTGMPASNQWSQPQV